MSVSSYAIMAAPFVAMGLVFLAIVLGAWKPRKEIRDKLLLENPGRLLLLVPKTQKLLANRSLVIQLPVILAIPLIILAFGCGWLSVFQMMFNLAVLVQLLLLVALLRFARDYRRGRSCSLDAGPNPTHRGALAKIAEGSLFIFHFSIIGSAQLVEDGLKWLPVATCGFAYLATQFIMHNHSMRIGGCGLFDGRWFFKWEDITWYRWYRNHDAILFGIGGRDTPFRFANLLVSNENRDAVEAILARHFPDRQLDDVEVAIGIA